MSSITVSQEQTVYQLKSEILEANYLKRRNVIGEVPCDCFECFKQNFFSSVSQESALSEEFSPPHTSSSTSPPVDSSSSRSSHPYQTLSQSSDEVTHLCPGLHFPITRLMTIFILSDCLCKHCAHHLFFSSAQPSDEPSCQASSWTTQQVCQWLRGLSMDQYVSEFTARDVDGQQLLQLDGNKLKVKTEETIGRMGL